YWGMPVLQGVGPIPATAYIPLALVLFTDAFLSGAALIALAVWFPVTMLTASGIANVPVSYLDVARTLGAGRGYLIFRVAIPAAHTSELQSRVHLVCPLVFQKIHQKKKNNCTQMLTL